MPLKARPRWVGQSLMWREVQTRPALLNWAVVMTEARVSAGPGIRKVPH